MFSRRHPYLFFLLIFSAIIFGSMSLMTLVFGIGSKSAEAISSEKVGIVEITGMIAESKDIIKEIKTFREDDDIKAIVLRVDSPGGGVGPSQEIYREVIKTIRTKKVIVSMGAVAASGGYYIASAADGIVANPGTITGSIGVIMGYTNFQEIFKKIGLTPVVIKSGKFKDMGSPVREMTEAEKALLQQFVDTIHDQFVRDAAVGRKMDIEKLRPLADGRIFTGEQAKELGLIDRIGNLEDAIEWAGRLGGIEGKVGRVYAKQEPLPILRYLMESSLKDVFDTLLHSRLSAEYMYRPGE